MTPFLLVSLAALCCGAVATSHGRPWLPAGLWFVAGWAGAVVWGRARRVMRGEDSR